MNDISRILVTLPELEDKFRLSTPEPVPESPVAPIEEVGLFDRWALGAGRFGKFVRLCLVAWRMYQSFQKGTFMTDWKTTLLGILAAVATNIGEILTSGQVTWRSVLTGIFLAILAYFAKDKVKI